MQMEAEILATLQRIENLLIVISNSGNEDFYRCAPERAQREWQEWTKQQEELEKRHKGEWR